MAQDVDPQQTAQTEQPDLAAAEHAREEPMGFILVRARSEVHLLLDNLSANPHSTIPALARGGPPAGLDPLWLEEVCEITWPPKKGDSGDAQMARDAARLIRVKDYLNSLAKPASGSTIAFTLMVAQEEEDQAENERQRKAARRQGRPALSRSSLARDAYPDLIPKAAKMRWLLKFNNWLLLGTLLFTLVLSWYVAVGNAAVTDLAGAKAELITASERVTKAQSALNARPADDATEPEGTAKGTLVTETKQDETRTAEPAANVGANDPDPCGTRDEGNARAQGAAAAGRDAEPGIHSYGSPELLQACKAYLAATADVAELETGLDRWAGQWGDKRSAVWGINLIGAAMLPVFYGLLGAIASVVRSLSRKIKRSILSPRDYQLSLQQLALGAVIGACISLFIAAPGDDGETGLLGPVTLSSSAISFVAGFGVESVFAALEALISRIFNIAPAGAAASDREDEAVVH